MNTIIVTLNREKKSIKCAEQNERLFNNAVVDSLIFERERIKFGNGHSDPLYSQRATAIGAEKKCRDRRNTKKRSPSVQ